MEKKRGRNMGSWKKSQIFRCADPAGAPGKVIYVRGLGKGGVSLGVLSVVVAQAPGTA